MSEQQTTGGTATAPATVLDHYTAFWNAGTEAEQLRLAALAFTDDVEYRAPVGVLTGARAMMGFRDQFIGHVGTADLRRRAEPETHHDRARLRWEIFTGEGGGVSFAAGTDVVAFAADGRIAAITSFLDRAPEGFTAPHDAPHDA